MDVTLGRGELEDQHVLGEPALVPGHHRGDAQGVAFLAQQGVAAIAGAERPDLPVLWEMNDVFGLVAGPGHIALARAQRPAYGVHRRHEEAVITQGVQSGLAHAGHDPHRDHHVGAIGNLHPQRADLRADRPHGERHDVHRAAAHGAIEETHQLGAHFAGLAPVVGRPRVGGLRRADEGPALHPGDIAGIRGGKEGVGPNLGIQAPQGSLLHHLGSQAIPLSLRAIAPADAIRLGQGGDLAHPGDQTAMPGRRRLQPRDR